MPVTAAITASTAVSAGAGIYSASKSADAATKAGQQTADATKYASDLAAQQYQQGVALQMPAYRTGLGALGLYASALGLPGYALQSGSVATGGTAGATGNTSISAPGGPDWNAYLSANPDVAQAYNSSTDPGFKKQFPTIQDFAAYHYQNNGQSEGRALPTTPGVAGALTGNTLQEQNQGALQNILGGSDIASIVKATPGYTTQLQQGLDAAQGSAAARGTLHSGGTLKALDTFGQNTFGSYYDKWLGNVGTLAGLGSSTATNIANQGTSAAANQGSLAITGAQAQGQAGVNAANAWSTGLGGATGSLSAALGANSQAAYNPYAVTNGTYSPNTATGYTAANTGYTGANMAGLY